jgi:hypothetical protein
VQVLPVVEIVAIGCGAEGAGWLGEHCVRPWLEPLIISWLVDELPPIPRVDPPIHIDPLPLPPDPDVEPIDVFVVDRLPVCDDTECTLKGTEGGGLDGQAVKCIYSCEGQDDDQILWLQGTPGQPEPTCDWTMSYDDLVRRRGY